MAIVKMSGSIADEFGSDFKMNAINFSECLRSMFVQLPGLQKYFTNNNFIITISGNKVSGNDDAEKMKHFFIPLAKDEVVYVTPAIMGAGSGGVGAFQIVAGVVAVAAAFWTGGASIAAWSAANMALAAGGAMMILGGVATLMVKTPSASMQKDAIQSENTSFSSVDNIAGQGQVHALIYGECMIGSMVGSQSIETL
ncbi:putative tail assembly protein [Serratia phage vB_SmaS_PhooPhighters]|uniref:Putative lambda tail assembly protein gpI family n=1 Tax=Serratia phage vB_SmaS_Rovert TaxID=2777363 RepID=A0A7T3N9X4_9CAUD|nr:putative lambda tail assembly protein gpI family [Serratia phage vB_SmaS_Rovert]QPX74987.1 putative lambda tail assembly protein gpI family [Serratia phage vB_SmaS_Rovert]UGO51960.1 putative tail assembly protein [Serratia phage vB_SmaS_PhooPhighters]